MNELTEKVIRCAFAVSNTLGCGFLEKVYENALAHELRKAGLKTDQQQGITIHYDGVVVGEYAADLLVEGALLVELKAVKDLDDIHLAQCLNYLRGCVKSRDNEGSGEPASLRERISFQEGVFLGKR